jgi:hypothetical protein
VAFLGALSSQARLPVPRPLVAVGAFRQFLKLSTSIGVGDCIQRGFEGLAGVLDQRLCLTREDFLGHLGDGLLSPHASFSFPREP